MASQAFWRSDTAGTPDAAPCVVIDTNAVLDWLLFRDAGAQALAAAVETGRVRWLACMRMRDEFERVLRYPALAPWAPDSERLLADFSRLSVLQPNPGKHPTLCCTDPDDQVFLDLAVATGARWLVSHDRALLRLARRARGHGLAILRPAVWTLPGNVLQP